MADKTINERRRVPEAEELQEIVTGWLDTIEKLMRAKTERDFETKYRKPDEIDNNETERTEQHAADLYIAKKSLWDSCMQ